VSDIVDEPFVEVVFVTPESESDDTEEILCQFDYWEWRALQYGLRKQVESMEKQFARRQLKGTSPPEGEFDMVKAALASALSAQKKMYESVGVIQEDHRQRRRAAGKMEENTEQTED